MVYALGCRTEGSGLRVYGSGYRSRQQCQGSGSGFGVLDIRFWVLGFGFKGNGLGVRYWVWDLEYRMMSLWFKI